MKKPYLVALVCGLVVLVGFFGFMYFQQTSNFMAQITQSTESLFSFSQATSTGVSSIVATTTVSTSTATTQPNTKVVAKTTQTPARSPTAGQAPKITKFEPAAGTVGTIVTIFGTGFDKTTNLITFGTTMNRHRSDGTADNVIATVASPDGKTLTFTVPTVGPSGLLCDKSNQCVGVSAMKIVPGYYQVTVENKFAISAPDTFAVIAQ